MSDGGAILILLYGALLGARHSFEPDHLAAVSTMAAHGSSRAEVLRVSAAWGAGHASLIILAGILLTSLDRQMPTYLAGRTDTLVGLALIAVGAFAMWPVIRVSSRAPRTRRFVQGLAGAASVIVGLLLVANLL